MKKKGTYSISVVSEMLGIHQQTIRLYEKEGFINPKRSDGNTRQFSQEDVEQLEKVIHLTHKLGINIAGVTMILKLQKKVKSLQGEINNLFDATKASLETEADELKTSARATSQELAALKKNSKLKNNN